MKDQEFDHILSKEQRIIPSSGFVVSVMDAVRRESAVPPPLPFPWKRALPGMFAAGLALVSMCVAGIMLFIPRNSNSATPDAAAIYIQPDF